MTIKIHRSYCANGDDVFIAWRPSDLIADCRGFQLERERAVGAGTVLEVVENRVGFTADDPQPNERRSSTEWPFQRFSWTDHAVDVGDRVRYRITARVGARGALADGPQSEWTDWIDLSPDVGGGVSCYFNRGLVLSQFVARYMRDNNLTAADLKAALQKSTDEFRSFLMGDLGKRVLEMLETAASNGTDLHAALYELGDDALETALIDVGTNLHLILANGSSSPDGNAASRARLRAADAGIEIVDRLLGNEGLGHNKFVVGTTPTGKRAVWTGSTNWTTTGLCTQINNGLLIENDAVADAFVEQWNNLKDASPPARDPADFPQALVDANDVAKDFPVGAASVHVRFTRTSDGSDTAELRKCIENAQQGILFLMFTPGPTGLHVDAAKRAKDGKYVRGVVSSVSPQNNDANYVDVTLVGGAAAGTVDRYSIVQPQGTEASFAEWIAEVTRETFLSDIGHAIVHSKVLVIDPFSDAPVVATGSHNFSKSASQRNDENLVIVRGHAKLARAYAANIMSVYQHYRWRSYVRQTLVEGKVPWSHLADDDDWLKAGLDSKAKENDFWVPS